jgi:enterochelin esterase-like enzyme
MDVELRPPAWATHLLSDLTDWLRAPLPVRELRPFGLPDDAYFEYAWLDADGQPKADPEDPNPARNPWWDYARGLQGPAYRPDPDAVPGDRRPAGRVLRLVVPSRILGQERHVLIYSPAGLADASLPAVYFQDGKSYFGWGRAAQVLDRLLSTGRVRAAHLIFVVPSDRSWEYVIRGEYLRFLVEELLPAVEARAPCDGQRIALGASLGGLLSAGLAWRHPDLFQTVAAQSGAFLYAPDREVDDPYRGPEWLRQQVRAAPRRSIRWYLVCGTLEWLAPCNLRLAESLRAKGYACELHLRHAGHNWVNWGDGLPGALRFALGPPDRGSSSR